MTSPNFKKKAFLYETTNLVNGKKCIGVRTYKYNRKDDEYLGTGVALKAAINKYGIANFSRKILVISTAEYCYDLERHLVNDEWVNSPNNYNISVGGWGGNRGHNAIQKCAISHKKLWKLKPDEEKHERKLFLDSIRCLTDIPKGKDNYKWKGYWVTPKGNFETCREAGVANGIDTRTIRARCVRDNKKVILRANSRVSSPEWVGNTWGDLGWGFIPKENISG